MAVHLAVAGDVFDDVLFCAVIFRQEMSWMRSEVELSLFLRIFLPPFLYIFILVLMIFLCQFNIIFIRLGSFNLAVKHLNICLSMSVRLSVEYIPSIAVI